MSPSDGFYFLVNERVVPTFIGSTRGVRAVFRCTGVPRLDFFEWSHIDLPEEVKLFGSQRPNFLLGQSKQLDMYILCSVLPGTKSQMCPHMFSMSSGEKHLYVSHEVLNEDFMGEEYTPVPGYVKVVFTNTTEFDYDPEHTVVAFISEQSPLLRDNFSSINNSFFSKYEEPQRLPALPLRKKRMFFQMAFDAHLVSEEDAALYAAYRTNFIVSHHLRTWNDVPYEWKVIRHDQSSVVPSGREVIHLAGCNEALGICIPYLLIKCNEGEQTQQTTNHFFAQRTGGSLTFLGYHSYLDFEAEYVDRTMYPYRVLWTDPEGGDDMVVYLAFHPSLLLMKNNNAVIKT